MKKTFILLFAVAFVLFACKQEEKPAEQVKKVTLEEINSNKFEYKGGEVEVEGLVVHVCSHSGKKMFIAKAEDPEMKLQILTSEAISAFPKDLEGIKVKVVGTLEEEKLYMDYANKLEEELKAEAKEVKDDPDHACAFEESMKKVQNLKEKIQNSPKGYVSKFKMIAKNYTKI